MAKNKAKTHYIIDQSYLEGLIKKALKVKKLSKVSVYPVKVRLTPNFEHVVLAVKARLPSGKKLGLYAMGHSSGIKKRLFDILKFFQARAGKTKLRVPEPLIYDPKTKSIIYKELSGPNLYAMFEKKKTGLVPVFSAFGRAVSRIHALCPAKIFKKEKHTTAELDPSRIMRDIDKRDRGLFKRIIRVKGALARQHPRIFKGSKPYVLVHGDLHPENVILLNKNFKNPRLGIIDVENANLYFRSYDLGSFLEQVKIMATPYYTVKQIDAFQKAFLDAYLKSAKIKMTPGLKKEITYYKAFFGIKAVIFYYRLGWHKKLKIILKRVEKYIDEIK